MSFISLDSWPWSNVFVNVIARPLLCKETRRQKELDLTHWFWRFQNSSYTAGKKNSNQDVNSHNTSSKTERSQAICKI